MTHIPDAISSESLHSLLQKEAPNSEVIPELNFGNRFGGPCDLQYVVSLIIAKSTNGVNLIQLLTCSLQLLLEAQAHFESRLQLLQQDQSHGLSPLKIAEVIEVTKRQSSSVASCISCLEAVLITYSPMSSGLRVSELLEAGVITEDTAVDANLRSILLISDEILSSLGVSREDITRHMNFQSNDK